ncbi:hypothetical protein [Halomonas cupida]|uniref:hypothetical protein n=1 Tax=Halomonas cupida TaxID=44933 RepID=UPI003A8E6BB0
MTHYRRQCCVKHHATMMHDDIMVAWCAYETGFMTLSFWPDFHDTSFQGIGFQDTSFQDASFQRAGFQAIAFMKWLVQEN